MNYRRISLVDEILEMASYTLLHLIGGQSGWHHHLLSALAALIDYSLLDNPGTASYQGQLRRIFGHDEFTGVA
jgi:hypothetical protein